MSVAMDYDTWEQCVSARIQSGSIWQFYGYRKSLYVYELAWHDCDLLSSDIRGKAIAQQLIRSAGSISANLEEGHGRAKVGTGAQYLSSPQMFWRPDSRCLTKPLLYWSPNSVASATIDAFIR